MAKRKQREMAERAKQIESFKMDLRKAAKKSPDSYEFVRVTAENAAKVIEWVIYHTEGNFVPKANYGDVIIRNLWDDSFEVWTGQAFDDHFIDITEEKN